MNINKIKIFLLSLFLGSFIVVSCNDLPTEIGYPLIWDTVNVAMINSHDTSLITGYENIINDFKVLNSGVVYVGKAGNLKAYTFFRFSIPDTLSKLNTIQSVELIMYPKLYSFGDTSSNKFGFQIKELTKLWTNEFSIDSLNSDPSIIGTKQVGAFIGNYDTNMSTIKIALDKDFIYKWLKMEADTNTAKLNYGFALIPDESSNIIKQFSAQRITNGSSTNPQTYIKVRYLNDSLKLDSLVFDAAMEFTFTTRPEIVKDEIQIQAGTGLRSKINFDFSMIPREAAIHKAEFILTVDKSRCQFGNIQPDTNMSINYFAKSDPNNENVLTRFFGQYNKSTGKFVFENITAPIEAIIRLKYDGNLVLIKNANDLFELHRLDKYSFYGINEPDINKRPYLQIIYSKRFISSSNGK